MPEAKFAGLTLLLGAMLISSHIAASEYCSKEQYQRDLLLSRTLFVPEPLSKGQEVSVTQSWFKRQCGSQ